MHVALQRVQCGCDDDAGHFNDPEHRRQQADEARAIARQLPNPESKAVVRRIPADYDRLAERRGLGPTR